MYEVIFKPAASASRKSLTKQELQEALKRIQSLRFMPVPNEATPVEGKAGLFYHLQIQNLTMAYEVIHGLRLVNIWVFLRDGPDNVIDILKG